MKRNALTFATFLLSFFTIISCSSTGKLTSVERDGLSYETAVIAKSVRLEYEWISDNYPGSRPQQQVLARYKRKPYDIITILTPTGESKDIYFDISSFYGKGF